MKTHTTGRGLALVAGILATCGALAILLQDAIRTNVWHLEHGLIPVIMAVQILTSHSVINALRSRRGGSALGFLFVAALATWGVFYTSVGKQSATSAESSLAAVDANDRRAKINQKVADAEYMLATCPANAPRKDYGERCGLRDAMNAECGSGKGKRCEGRKYSVDTYEAALAGYQKQLADIGPVTPIDAKADKMAELISTVRGSDKETTKRFLLLIEPFTYASIFELAALVSFGFAFGGTKRETEADRWNARKPWAGQLAQPSVKETLQSSFAVAGLLDNPGNSGNPANGQPKRPGKDGNSGNRRGPKPDNPRNGGNRPSSQVEFESDVLTRLALGQSIDSQDDLAAAHHVHKGTASKWLKDMRQRGLIPAAQRVGRCHVLRSLEPLSGESVNRQHKQSLVAADY